MIDISSKVRALFESDSTFKTYTLTFPEVKKSETEIDKPEKILTSKNLLSDSITLTEPMCSEEQLKYGCCEAATFEFEMEYDKESLEGRIFNVVMTLGNALGGEETENFTVGRYLVDEEEISNDRKSKTITAYDIMYVLNNLDVTYWYYTLEFPLTIKQLRDSLMSYVNQEQVERTLPNDNLYLAASSLDGETDITFETIMTGLCEWNACFGHINREGKFDYVSLTAEDNEETYPSKETFPSHETFPKSIRSKNYYIRPQLIKSDIEWKNYMCKTVDTVQIRNKAGAAILEYHLPEKETYSNIYVIQNNWMTDCFDSSTLETAAHNFANAIAKVTYQPCTANVKMNLAFEVGDAITLTGTDGTRIPTFIFQRTMTGDCSAFDEFEATGYEEWVNDPPDLNGAMSSMMDSLTDLSDRVDALEQNEDGGLSILSVASLPEAPKKNVLYLVQGRIGVY